jgi:hypothetical protein
MDGIIHSTRKFADYGKAGWRGDGKNGRKV